MIHHWDPISDIHTDQLSYPMAPMTPVWSPVFTRGLRRDFGVANPLTTWPVEICGHDLKLLQPASSGPCQWRDIGM
jgi:hypothetical protein